METKYRKEGYFARYSDVLLNKRPYAYENTDIQADIEWLLGWDQADHELMMDPPKTTFLAIFVDA